MTEGSPCNKVLVTTTHISEFSFSQELSGHRAEVPEPRVGSQYSANILWLQRREAEETGDKRSRI